MDIEKVILEDDLNQTSREAQDYKHRVAMAYVGIQGLLEHYAHRPEYSLVVDDLRKIERILDGYYVNTNEFRHSAS
jgi:hypothetical protein